MTYVKRIPTLTYMEKIQVYFPPEELSALRKAAARTGRSLAELVREAVRKQLLAPQAKGPVALWDGETRQTSLDHDSIYDDP